MALGNTTKSFVIEDFKPGIFSDYHAAGAVVGNDSNSVFDPKINGAAVVDDTWACCADRSGALVPLPRVVTGKTSGLDPVTARGTVINGDYLIDALVLDGMQANDDTRNDAPEIVMMQNWIGPTGTSTNFASYLRVRRHEQWRDVPVTSDVSFTRVAVASTETDAISGTLTPIRGAESETVATTDEVKRGFAWVAHVPYSTPNLNRQWNAGGSTLTDNDALYTDWDTKYAGVFSDGYPPRVNGSQVGYFPNMLAPFTIPPVGPGFVDGSANSTYRNAHMVIGHQGRIVIAQRIPSNYLNTVRAWKDRLVASALLQPYIVGGGGEFVEENTSGIGAMASLSADELFVVKHGGGGYLLRGSVTSPTVVKLPFIESTYGIVHSPIATPMGLVYGSRNGVFLWEGETSRHLSPQLDGFFWNHLPAGSNVRYQGHQARFGYWHPWVMVPNGYMLDTRTGSWWRLDDPVSHQSYNVYGVDERGRLYAFPHRVIADVAPMDLWRTADPHVLASSYSWKSQPLAESRDTAYRVHEIVLLATATSASSRVTVTISGYTHTGALVTIPAVQFDLSNNFDRPQLVRLDVQQGTDALSYIQVRIEGASLVGDAAPKVHRVELRAVETRSLT
jgi:hypothetical protein